MTLVRLIWLELLVDSISSEEVKNIHFLNILMIDQAIKWFFVLSFLTHASQSYSSSLCTAIPTIPRCQCLSHKCLSTLCEAAFEV